MATERYVVLALAPVRTRWFATIARWSTAATVPIDVVKCVSAEELRARLAGGRPFSAAIVDAATPGLDRDLIDVTGTVGLPVIVVSSAGPEQGHDWRALGAVGHLGSDFTRDELLAALDAWAVAIRRPQEPTPTSGGAATPAAWRGRLVAVTGAGGTGSSVTAMALAGCLAADLRSRGEVLLADLALDADLAMLHAAEDVVPALQELLDAVRLGTPDREQVRALTFGGDRHPYRLLLGLRRHRDWTVLRARAVEAALDALVRQFSAVVVDVDADVEGERTCGSVDVEERNLLARTATRRADLVVVTAHAGVQGVHRLVRVVTGLVDHGVAPGRVLPVIVRAPRRPRARAELARAVAELTAGAGGDPVLPVAFVPPLRSIDRLLRDGLPAPTALGRPVADVLRALEPPVGRADEPGPVPEPVRPGSLGTWAVDEELG